MLNDRYELTERLGAGGTGEVFRAFDVRLGREVAIKLLRAGSTDASAHARMDAEARFAGALIHPCVARVLDYDVTDEDPARPFIVMEHVEGVSLARLLREEGALSPERTMRIVADIASALHVAHQAGVVHRDVKPGNVIVTPAGRAVLVDFGIARSSTSEPLTSTGSIVGTADYLSPEQATGRPATARSDLYSLGVVAYACLTGGPPFPRENDVATALAQVSEPLPRLLDVPAPVANLVRRMTAKPPHARPSTAAEVEVQATRLAAQAGAWSDVAESPTGRLLLGPEPLEIPRHRARRTGLVVLPVAGLAAVLAMVLGVFAFTPTVPAVVGLDVQEATALLADAGISAERELVDEPGEEAGVVLAQTPEPGAEDDLVMLDVASGKVRLAEDDVVGRRLEVATAELTELGLAVRVDREPTTAAKVGTVMAIDRSGRLPVGSEVTLTVATPPPETVAAPTASARRSTSSEPATPGPGAKKVTGKGKGKAKGKAKGKGPK